MALATALSAWAACGGPRALPEPADGGGPPAVVSVSAPREGASRTDPIVVAFDPPVDAAALPAESVVLLAGEASAAFLSDLANPPLSAANLADLVDVELTVAADGTQASAQPRLPLAPQSPYTLAVSGAVRGLDGRELGESFAYAFTTGGAEAGAPELALRVPAPGVAAPTNLARVVVAFSEPVTGVGDGSLALEGVAGRVVAADRWCSGCFAIELDGTLAPDAEHRVLATGDIRDADGEAPIAATAPRVLAAAGPDLVPPVLGAAEVDVADGCVVGRWVTDEPASAALAGSAALDAFDPTPALLHEVAARAASGAYEVWLESADLADGAGRAGPFAVEVGAPPAVVITEVLANPAGTEPTQEWIEIANVGGDAIDLGGFTISDSTGSDVLPAATLAPGAVGLVVGASFDALSPDDPPPHPAAVLLRLDGAIGDAGLRNSGERVRLADAAGTVVSSFRGLETRQARSAVRVGACDTAASWVEGEEGGATPGALAPGQLEALGGP